MKFREKLLVFTLAFFFLNILIFTALFAFSPEFQANGTTFAGMILGNLTLVIGGLGGWAYASKEGQAGEESPAGAKSGEEKA